MKQISEPENLREYLRSLPGQLAFVPTMGNLHAGHLRLVERALTLTPSVVVSIFVNPLQFDKEADLQAYPRTLDEDCQKLHKLGVPVVFTPTVESIYPGSMQRHTRVEVPYLSDQLCGASRPGHFVGVTTIVCKLFNMIQPRWAIFGEKDYQQLLLIRRMVHDLAMPIEIVGVETVREADGLAMSSRNNYLNDEQRRQAPALYRVLQAVAERLRQGVRDYVSLQEEACASLEQAGLKPDYIAIRRLEDLALPGADEQEWVILGAAYLGLARLIDNIQVRL